MTCLKKMEYIMTVSAINISFSIDNNLQNKKENMMQRQNRINNLKKIKTDINEKQKKHIKKRI